MDDNIEEANPGDNIEITDHGPNWIKGKCILHEYAGSNDKSKENSPGGPVSLVEGFMGPLPPPGDPSPFKYEREWDREYLRRLKEVEKKLRNIHIFLIGIGIYWIVYCLEKIFNFGFK